MIEIWQAVAIMLVTQFMGTAMTVAGVKVSLRYLERDIDKHDTRITNAHRRIDALKAGV